MEPMHNTAQLTKNLMLDRPWAQGSGSYVEKAEKVVRARGDEWHQGNSVFQTQQDWGTYELT